MLFKYVDHTIILPIAIAVPGNPTLAAAVVARDFHTSHCTHLLVDIGAEISYIGDILLGKSQQKGKKEGGQPSQLGVGCPPVRGGCGDSVGG